MNRSYWLLGVTECWTKKNIGLIHLSSVTWNNIEMFTNSNEFRTDAFIAGCLNFSLAILAILNTSSAPLETGVIRKKKEASPWTSTLYESSNIFWILFPYCLKASVINLCIITLFYIISYFLYHSFNVSFLKNTLSFFFAISIFASASES